MKNLFLLSIISLVLSSCMTTRLERQENRRKAKCEKHGCYTSVSDSMMIIRKTITIREDTTIFVHVQGMVKHDTTVIVKEDPQTGLIQRNQYWIYLLQPLTHGLKMAGLNMTLFRKTP